MRYSIRPYSILSVALFVLEVFGVGAAFIGIAYLIIFIGGIL